MRKRLIFDKMMLFLIVISSTAIIIPLFLIFIYIFKEGLSVISWDFLSKLPKPVGEKGGGIFNAIVGTFIIVFLSSIMAVPVGVGTGIYLYEKKRGRFVDLIKVCVDILQASPSIILGIIAYIWIVKPMGRFSAISGSVALAIMMLPVIIYNTEESLKMIPYTMKEAAFALGAPYYKVMIKVIIPSALSGIVTGILVGISRIAGETAPLLFTAFGNPHLELNPFKPMSSLPLLIFNYALSPYQQWIKQAWGASLVLCMMVFLLNLLSKTVTKRWKITS